MVLPETTRGSVEPVEQPLEEKVGVDITFYVCPPFCGHMASGETVYDGAAACGYAFSLGQEFILAGKTFTCEDRGLGSLYWVDIWFPGTEAEGHKWRASLKDNEITLIPP